MRWAIFVEATGIFEARAPRDRRTVRIRIESEAQSLSASRSQKVSGYETNSLSRGGNRTWPEFPC